MSPRIGISMNRSPQNPEFSPHTVAKIKTSSLSTGFPTETISLFGLVGRKLQLIQGDALSDLSVCFPQEQASRECHQRREENSNPFPGQR
jgi:hypothetical protein